VFFFLVIIVIVFLLFFFFFILLSISFVTILERHVLGLSHNRLGPNKVSFLGFFQAVYDGLKLFKKEFIIIYFIYSYYYFIIPLMVFFFMFIQ
jgi:NADH:ubiquinone oxidoreductase subunit H